MPVRAMRVQLGRRLLVGCAVVAVAAPGLAAASVLPASAQETGALRIEKKVTDGTGPDAGIFTFSGSWGESFPLVAGESRTTVLSPGAYSFSEGPMPGYDFLGIACSGPSGALSSSGFDVTVEVAAAQTTSCTSTSKPIIDIDVDPAITGSAGLRVRRSCARPTRLVAWVRAGNARWVSFRVGGRWVATVHRPIRGKTFRVVTLVGRGATTVSAHVRFVAGASPEERRLRRSVPACQRPVFAGSSR